jgi:uracil-DNA glycosylase family 4
MSMKQVVAEGIPDKLLFVGDFPTTAELGSGKAWSGSTGALLARLCSPFKFNPGSKYKTYYYKVGIPGYNAPNKKIREQALTQAKEEDNWDWILKEELEAINPNVIVAMGELALQALTPEKSIEKWRGSILHLHERFKRPAVKVVPTLSPREIWQRNEKPNVYVQWDISKAMGLRNSTVIHQPKELVWIADSYTKLKNWWDRVRGTTKFLTLDIETHHGFITCIGFCHDGVSRARKLVPPHK